MQKQTVEYERKEKYRVAMDMVVRCRPCHGYIHEYVITVFN